MLGSYRMWARWTRNHAVDLENGGEAAFYDALKTDVELDAEAVNDEYRRHIVVDGNPAIHHKLEQVLDDCASDLPRQPRQYHHGTLF